MGEQWNRNEEYLGTRNSSFADRVVVCEGKRARRTDVSAFIQYGRGQLYCRVNATAKNIERDIARRDQEVRRNSQSKCEQERT